MPEIILGMQPVSPTSYASCIIFLKAREKAVKYDEFMNACVGCAITIFKSLGKTQVNY